MTPLWNTADGNQYGFQHALHSRVFEKINPTLKYCGRITGINDVVRRRQPPHRKERIAPAMMVFTIPGVGTGARQLSYEDYIAHMDGLADQADPVALRSCLRFIEQPRRRLPKN